jgi:hypothetical protein
MKLTSFIKIYKIALSHIVDATKDWPRVYLGEVIFPGFVDVPKNKIRLVFASTSDMEPGSLGLQLSFNIESIDSLKGGLDNVSVAKEYINSDVEINDAGRLLLVLENILNHYKSLYPDHYQDIELNSFYFNFDKGTVVFDSNITDGPINTDGHLFLVT